MLAENCVEWIVVNKTDNKVLVTHKFCNDLISAKIERIHAHMSKCKKCGITSRLNTDDDAESLNKMLNNQKKGVISGRK